MSCPGGTRAVLEHGAKEDDLRKSADEGQQLGCKRIRPFHEGGVRNPAWLTAPHLRTDLRKSRSAAGTGNVEDRLHQSRRRRRAKAVAPEHNDGWLDGLHCPLSDAIVRAVRHPRAISHQRRVARATMGTSFRTETPSSLMARISSGRNSTPREVLPLWLAGSPIAARAAATTQLMGTVLLPRRSGEIRAQLESSKPPQRLGGIEDGHLRGLDERCLRRQSVMAPGPPAVAGAPAGAVARTGARWRLRGRPPARRRERQAGAERATRECAGSKEQQ